MSDFIKREKANFGRESRQDFLSAQEQIANRQARTANALFALGQSVQRNIANNKNTAWNTYLQTRAVKMKAELTPALEKQSDFDGIDAQLKAFDEWDKKTRESIMGGSDAANKYLSQNGQGVLLKEQTDVLANAAKVRLTDAQAVRDTDELIKASAQNYALTKDESVRAQIDEGFLKAIEQTQTYADGGLTMRARTAEEVNKIYAAYKGQREAKVNEADYLAALNLAKSAPESLSKTILNPKKWTTLTNQQREHLFNAAQAQTAAKNKTSAAKDLEPLKNKFLELWQTNPLEANKYFQDLNAHRGDAVNRFGFDASKLETVLNYMEGVLQDPNTDFALQNAEKFEKAQTDFNLMFDGEGLTSGGNVESVTAFVSALREDISAGNYTGKKREDAQRYIKTLAKALGEDVLNGKEELRDTNPPGFLRFTSVSEYMQKKLRTAAEDEGFTAGADGGLDAEDWGSIYVNAYNALNKNGIPTDGYWKDYKEQADAIFTAVKMRFIADKYDIPAEQVQSAIINGRIIKLKEAENGK
ncbi:MAG: hypothetical protein PUB86_02535 [Elusimicrobia bacterium]|nr:hypothetical protein [Elusimicrobiota bacterium]